jgi:hypothetical protein
MRASTTTVQGAGAFSNSIDRFLRHGRALVPAIHVFVAAIAPNRGRRCFGTTFPESWLDGLIAQSDTVVCVIIPEAVKSLQSWADVRGEVLDVAKPDSRGSPRRRWHAPA